MSWFHKRGTSEVLKQTVNLSACVASKLFNDFTSSVTPPSFEQQRPLPGVLFAAAGIQNDATKMTTQEIETRMTICKKRLAELEQRRAEMDNGKATKIDRIEFERERTALLRELQEILQNFDA